MSDDFLVVNGGSLKSLSDTGKVGGHLCLFDEIDLQGEFFHQQTDFWLEGKSLLPLIFDHGRDATLRRRKLTHVYFDVQPEGLWIEGRLPLGSGPEIERVWAAVKADELGLSSGTSGHLAAREPTERGVRIDEWPLAEASIARRPAQPKSRAVALKSLPTSDFASLSPRRDYEQEAAAIYAETLMRQHKLRMNGDIPSQTAEQRAAEIYAELLQSQHKMRMAEFERSMHHDDRAEEQQVYAAMAQLKAWRVRQNR